MTDYINPAEDPTRNYVTITAPDDGYFIDNVLGIQNKSHDYRQGNAAINFLDRNGIERGAMGYSRNSSLSPNVGYFPDFIYVEHGCPFDEGTPTDFRLQLSIKPGGPYWGGAGVSYASIEVSGKTGAMNFRAPGTGGITFEKGPQFGLDGVPQTVSFAMGAMKARIREDTSANNFTISTNDASIGSGGPLVQDQTNAASWRMSMFGYDDTFKVQRAAPGATSRASYADFLRISASGDMLTCSNQVGQTTRAPGTDGQLAVTSTLSSRAALTLKGAGNSSAPTSLIWNPETTGNSIFARFGTDTTFVERGSISFNRASAVVAYNTTSDRRAKDVFGQIDDALDRVMAIKAYRGRMLGAEMDMDMVIADELQEVAPYAVTGEPDGPEFQQVDLAKLVPLLISALQDQQRQIVELRTRVG